MGSQRVASASFQETTRMGTYNVAEPNFGRKASNAWQAYVARRGSPDGMSVRGRRRFRRNHPYGNLDVAAPNFGTKDPSELAGAGFEESTLMGTYNVARPNFGRKDRSEQATFEETTLMGTYNVAGPNCGRNGPCELAGAGFEETTLMGTYNVAGPKFGRKDRFEQATHGRRRFRRKHPYGNL